MIPCELENLFSSIDNSLYDVLDKVTFISSDILRDSNFETIFESTLSKKRDCNRRGNSLFVLLSYINHHCDGSKTCPEEFYSEAFVILPCD